MSEYFTPAMLRQAAQILQREGSKGDTILAHVNPREVALLKKHGGSGTINPKTGLMQFDPDGSDGSDSSGNGGLGGSGPDAGPTGGPGSGPEGSGPDLGGSGPNAGPIGGPGSSPNTSNEGVDMGLGEVGPTRGMTITGPSPAGILGAIAAGLAGPAVAGINTLTGFADDNGKTAASKTMGLLGISSEPMGSISFGGEPMGGKTGTSNNGPSPSNEGRGNEGQPFGPPYYAPIPSAPSQNSAQLAAQQSQAPFGFQPGQSWPIGNPIHPLLRFGFPFR